MSLGMGWAGHSKRTGLHLTVSSDKGDNDLSVICYTDAMFKGLPSMDRA
jgi:hypothetical protein